jgi:predicted RND superfamily exporter protein
LELPQPRFRWSTWIQAVSRNSGKIVFAVLLAALASAVFSARIRVDANLESLLPTGSETVRALKETQKRFGSADLFTISIVGSDPAVIARIQDTLRSRMVREWPFVQSVQIARNQEFFRHHALLYLPQEQLEHIERHLGNLRDDLLRGPLGMDLLSDSAPKDTTWFDAKALDRLGLPQEASSEFRKFLGPGSDTAPDPKARVPDSLKAHLLGGLPDGRFVGVVQAVLSRPSSDIEFTKDVLSRSRSLLSEVSKPYGKGIEIGVEGPYKDLGEVDALAKNGTIATVVSVLLTLLIMVVVFRRAGPILLVLGQASISCAFTLGFATLVYGQLNLYTVFVIAILFGMGTDYSFYVVGHAQRLVRAGAAWEDALAQTFRDLSSSLGLAWLTTIAGLLVLLLSKFPGFHEFGVIASVGITTSLVLTWIFLPAAVFLAERISKHPIASWLSPDPSPRWRGFAMRTWMEILPRDLAIAAVIGAVCALPFASRIGFEYDFARLQEPRDGSQKTLPVQEALGTKLTSSQPVVVLVRDPVTLDRIHDTLLRRLAVDRDTLLAGFLTPRSFLPPRDLQEARIPHLRRIGAILQDPVFDRATGPDSQAVANLRDMARTDTFSWPDLPAWSRDLLRERDGSTGRIGFIYDRITNSDSRDAERFERRYGHFGGPGDSVSCFSSSFVYADLVHVVRLDSLRMTKAMVLVLCLLIVVVFRRWRPVLVCFSGMAVAIAWMLGIMGMFDIRLNIFNLIVITTLQAALTDVVIYMVLAWERQGRTGIGQLYSGMGTLMTVAIGTTISGFAGMLFTSHPGIRSIGSFAVVGLVCCLAASLAVVPWLCSVLLPPPPPSTPEGLE